MPAPHPDDRDLDALLQQILRATLDAGGADLEGIVRKEWSTWDSLVHVSLVFTVEQEVGIELTPEEMAAIVSLDTLRQAVRTAILRGS